MLCFTTDSQPNLKTKIASTTLPATISDYFLEYK